MTSIIVLFPRIEDAKSIKGLLVRNGYSVEAVCTTGSAALQATDNLDYGIVVCGYKFADMMYTEVKEYLPEGIEMLLMTSKAHLEEIRGTDIMCVEMPLKVHDLLSTIGMMVENIERRRRKKRQQPKIRNDEEIKLINSAKALLMDRNNFTEDEAHKYLQKTSMDSGTNIVETAQMVLALMNT